MMGSPVHVRVDVGEQPGEGGGEAGTHTCTHMHARRSYCCRQERRAGALRCWAINPNLCAQGRATGTQIA